MVERARRTMRSRVPWSSSTLLVLLVIWLLALSVIFTWHPSQVFRFSTWLSSDGSPGTNARGLQSAAMTPEEFRAAGHRIVDWIADYRARAASLPVLAGTEPGDVKRQLPASPPGEAEAFEAIVADLDRIV